MFSPDDLTPALIAVPYVTTTIKRTVVGSARYRLLAAKPGWCNYFPWFCRW